ncbi:hypothetical protein HYALB_00006718 [Hymenoscyphus albidus]|uniref:Uncharacterized protein n=1 Tax=Hymenoscyphus albidus TaxID=595503 RepID=A0A9N9LTC0_9HELO|nr:hypothetical protein HYALB_00006718 [Hymenoscyphus albidus]
MLGPFRLASSPRFQVPTRSEFSPERVLDPPQGPPIRPTPTSEHALSFLRADDHWTGRQRHQDNPSRERWQSANLMILQTRGAAEAMTVRLTLALAALSLRIGRLVDQVFGNPLAREICREPQPTNTNVVPPHERLLEISPTVDERFRTAQAMNNWPAVKEAKGGRLDS